jgi:DNA repair exonuclease SbcCD ATPase subunit
MKTPKALSEGFVSAKDMATKVSTCRRLAGGIRAIDTAFLGLSEKDRETLTKAIALLEEISTVFDKAARLKKRADEVRAKREKEVRAAMKDNFNQLATTADKVALIAAARSYTFPYELTTRHDATYLLGSIFNDCLDSVAYEVEADAHRRAIALQAALAEAWQRFTERRAALQDKHAQVIVRVDRLLAPAAVAGSPS